MLFIALTFGMLGYGAYGFAYEGWMMWAAIPIFSLVGYFSPAIQGLMTRRVTPQEQGQLQGANSSLMGIAGILGPLLFTRIFSASIRDDSWQLPGLPFLVAAAMHAVAIVLAFLIWPRKD